LLKRSREPETLAVMAHDIGHWAMNHIPKVWVMFGGIIWFGTYLFLAASLHHLPARGRSRPLRPEPGA
jgi:Zn-dependent protease with chaperone function